MPFKLLSELQVSILQAMTHTQLLSSGARSLTATKLMATIFGVNVQ